MLSKKLPYWNKAIAHLKQNDKILAKIISSHHKDYLIINNQYFISLIKAIIGQQISVKAAQSIWIRFSRKYRPITVKKISKEKINSLKKIGLSKQKALYIKNIAIFFTQNKKKINNWNNLEDHEIIEDLVKIKGIGIWTAEMFLMFSLGRSNIFPTKDLGLLKAISKNYKKEMPINDIFLKKLEKKWEPWCSVATWYLWKSIDPVNISY